MFFATSKNLNENAWKPTKRRKKSMKLKMLTFAITVIVMMPFVLPCQAQPVIVGAQVLLAWEESATNMSLPSGCQLYVYGAATGGGVQISAFASGQTIQLQNVNGNISAELVVSTNSNNGFLMFPPGGNYDVFGGFGATGFNYAQGFYGVNPGPGPNLQASVQFTLSAPAMVAVMGMCASQKILTLSGLSNPTIDVPVQVPTPSSGDEALIIAHQYLSAGTYTIQETTAEGSVGDTPNNEDDLIGVLIFSDYPFAASSTNPPIPIPGSSQLNDNFTADPNLNTALWTTQSSFLSALNGAVSSSGSTLLPPTLSFGSAGMQMTGVTGTDQFAAIQSLATFTPPFTVTTTVMGTESYGNAFAIYLVNSDISQWFDILGDLIPQTGYQNIWINWTDSGVSLGNLYSGTPGSNVLYGNPSLDVFYTFQISVGTDGNASVVLMANGVSLASRSGLSVGNGLFYLVLGQKEGLPYQPGPLAAIWQSVSVTALPLVSTGGASAITATTATLSGSVNPNDLATTAYFQWGTSTNYGNTVPNPAFSCGNANTVSNLTITLTGLNPNTTYYYQLVASSSAGTAYGTDQTFTTLSIPTNPSGTGGTLQIVSGSGSFSSVSPANKILNVYSGATLNGTVNLQTFAEGCDFCVVPLIYTPSWGNDSTSWQLINSGIPNSGYSSQTANVSLTAPTRPGVYYIIFAFQWEIGGDHVASASNWALGYDVWNDGNDIAEFNAAQISSAQLNGYALDEWLYGGPNGTTVYEPQYVPSDAITLIVGTPPVAGTAYYARSANISLKIAISDLLTNVTGGDGPITLVGVGTDGLNLLSTNGTTLFTNSTYILYTNSVTPNVNDSFNYTVSDSLGESGIGTVLITINNNNIVGQTNVNLIVSSTNVTANFFGVPGFRYTVDRSTNLTQGLGWVPISTNTAPTNGLMQVVDNFLDLGIMPSNAFYRLRYNPSN
jgi:hypothetical protein